MACVTGFELVRSNFPAAWRGRNVAVLCHAPSISRDFTHIIDFLAASSACRLVAVFGPQHGVMGQTQDNMIEWEGFIHPVHKIPVYSLYGEHRRPTPEMLRNVDILLVDLQDVGTRVYTYVWTLRLCMEQCARMGIKVVVLDRPNPISEIPPDGALLDRRFFTFVGMAEIPLCHGMTIGELAVFLREHEVPDCDLEVVKMLNFHHGMSFADCRLPWANMPTCATAAVYPGAVLVEALNLSEGRGSTTPFELLGAPWLRPRELKAVLDAKRLPGCAFRIHDYIPTFHKFAGKYCGGIQVHVTDPSRFRPVRTFMEIFRAILQTSPGALEFLPPPYEYEEKLTPFDILSGDSSSRLALENGTPLDDLFAIWDASLAAFDGVNLY